MSKNKTLTQKQFIKAMNEKNDLIWKQEDEIDLLKAKNSELIECLRDEENKNNFDGMDYVHEMYENSLQKFLRVRQSTIAKRIWKFTSLTRPLSMMETRELTLLKGRQKELSSILDRFTKGNLFTMICDEELKQQDIENNKTWEQICEPYYEETYNYNENDIIIPPIKEQELIDNFYRTKTRDEHLNKIHSQFNGNIRDYLLSMGPFKEVPIDEDLDISD